MPRKPDFDRDDVIDRARALFWRRGWAGTSLKDLEETLKIKPGSFYAAFGSKDALFALALDRYADDSLGNLRRLAAEHGPIGALQALPQQIVENDCTPAKACMLSKTLLELQGRDHRLATKANDHLLAMEKEIAQLFDQAQKAGDVGASHDPQHLARRYQSDLMGLRISAERPGIDAAPIAKEIADGLEKLR
ncbi:MAG: TetR/AcrR family transcriptional regulator [Pseudomonadota bacterium]